MARGVCDVCRLVRGDKSEKDVRFCGLCQANLCEQHRSTWNRERIKAALMTLRGY